MRLTTNAAPTIAVAPANRRPTFGTGGLLVSRPFGKGDGLPAAIERVDTKDRHVIGFFYPPMLKLQQDYARRLLTHRNPHTRRTYAEDPAVAFVEINNENGLLHAWLAGHVDNLPDVFLRDLWPSGEEVEQAIRQGLGADLYNREYAHIF